MQQSSKNQQQQIIPNKVIKPLTVQNLFIDSNLDWILLKDHLKKQGKLTLQAFGKIIQSVTQIFKNQPNLMHLNDPITIVGDIHGQYYDLLTLLQVVGNPSNTNYLFLGDYVDRGSFSIETVLLLFALKISYPKNIYLLRGNHECRYITTLFNFRSQCLAKYNQDIYDRIMDCFDNLPIAVILNNKFFCVHGGISPALKTVDQIKKINRFSEIPKQGLFCDLVWSDPVDNDDGKLSSSYIYNQNRGCSYIFGQQSCKIFLEKNKLSTIIRAHEVENEGFRYYKWNSQSQFPTVATVFSAPNYCDVYKNKGAVIKVINNTFSVQQFNYTNHPYMLPNFLDVFSWSIPFIIDKVNEMFYHIIKPDEKLSAAQLQAFQFTNKVKIMETSLVPNQKKKKKIISSVRLDGKVQNLMKQNQINQIMKKLISERGEESNKEKIQLIKMIDLDIERKFQKNSSQTEDS